ncbi:Brain-specific serine protease 4 [Trachymyrmex cornetzi]|uniref:Brain-specific serine protease 4 n=1 Tax=Trachymyrmex cornetzi TaxID=471704 RepID=A0A195EET4_9HYME|nr:Brain-specific serine protease 4 [Trachymyrmex cornetzi]
MSRLYVLVAVVAMTINVTITSEKMKHRHDQIEKPIMIRKDTVFSRNQDVVPFTESSSVFFLHLLKCKPRYQKLDRIFPTTPVSVRDCICVPFYLCDRNLTIITDGTGIIDPRFTTNRICGDLEICCYPPNVTNTAMIPVVTSPMTNVPPMTPPATTSPTSVSDAPTVPTSATSLTTADTVLLDCICVMISLCDPNGIVSISGEGVINPRYGLCPDNLVCCRILANMTQPMTSSSTISIIPLTSATITRVSSIVTKVSPSQMQLCFICDNVNLCFTCMIDITSGGGAMLDSRVSQILSDGNICTSTNIPSCLKTSSAAPITDLGQLKNPGTSQECYCVKTWLCFEGNAVSPDGLGIIDSRFTLCSSADQVCCRLAGINRQDLQSASSSSAVANGSSNRSVSQITCGIQNNSYAPSQPFSSDSEKTYFAEFPWMVALLLKSTTGPYIFHCGASIISNGAILTAAHCVANQKPENLIARFGQWNIGNNIQPLPIQEVKIVAIAIHPSYYNDGLFHDVAVLVLEKSITYSANVLPICLPEQGKVFLAGTRCYGLGWGSSSFGPEGQYQAELRKVNLPIINQDDCQTRLRSTKLGQYFQLHGSFICAGGETNKDTCRGDGGGPLVCQTATGQFFQKILNFFLYTKKNLAAGIVSWGIGCGASNVPAVYASVSQHRQWIDQQFATYGI